MLRLIRSRLEPSIPNHIPGTVVRSSPKLMSITGDSLVPVNLLVFNLPQLQEDILSHYLSGKPIINDISSLRIVFKFRQDKVSVTKRQVSEYVIVSICLSIYLSVYLSIYLSAYLSIYLVQWELPIVYLQWRRTYTNLYSCNYQMDWRNDWNMNSNRLVIIY